MSHSIRIFGWAIGGLILSVCALLVPAHFRAVDIKLIESAGAETPSIVQSAVSLVNLEKTEAASMLWQTAPMLHIAGHDELKSAIPAGRERSQASLVKADAVFETFSDLFWPAMPRPIIEPLLERGTREK